MDNVRTHHSEEEVKQEKPNKKEESNAVHGTGVQTNPEDKTKPAGSAFGNKPA